MDVLSCRTRDSLGGVLSYHPCDTEVLSYHTCDTMGGVLSCRARDSLGGVVSYHTYDAVGVCSLTTRVVRCEGECHLITSLIR